MNSKFKVFMMALLILPISICFAGCGQQIDSKAQINVNGNYKAVATNEQVADYVRNCDMSIFDNFKMTFKTNTTQKDTATNKTYTTNVNYNLIFKNQSAKTELVMKLDANINMPSMKSNSNFTTYCVTESAEETVYLNGKFERNGTTINGKYKLSGINATGISSFVDELKQMSEQVNPQNFDKFDIQTIKKSENDKSVKFKITLKLNEDKTTDLYYVFENNKFMGLQLKNYNLTLPDGNTKISLSASMSAFNEEIEFDTNGYADYTQN